MNVPGDDSRFFEIVVIGSLELTAAHQLALQATRRCLTTAPNESVCHFKESGGRVMRSIALCQLCVSYYVLDCDRVNAL